MLSTTRVDLPAAVVKRLRIASGFVDNIMEYAREDLVGFRRPLAAAFAVSAPVLLASVFYSAGPMAALQAGAGFCAFSALALFLVGRQVWPELVEDFETHAAAKRKAIADLKCGFGELGLLNLIRSPRFFDYEDGVLVFADAGDFRTLFFWITNDPEDSRWELYTNGELNRRVWRWLRLPVSREIVKFSTEGSRLPGLEAPGKINSVDAWEAIHAALGEPMDGAIIHQPFSEIVEMVERLL